MYKVRIVSSKTQSTRWDDRSDMHTCICMRRYICICVNAKGHSASSVTLHLILWDRVPHWFATCWIGSAGWLGSHCLCFPSAEIIRLTHNAWLFSMDSEGQMPSSRACKTNTISPDWYIHSLMGMLETTRCRTYLKELAHWERDQERLYLQLLHSHHNVSNLPLPLPSHSGAGNWG